jgi:hypothetical protein
MTRRADALMLLSAVDSERGNITSHHGRGCDHECESAPRVVDKTRTFPAPTAQLEKTRMLLRCLLTPSVAVDRRLAEPERRCTDVAAPRHESSCCEASCRGLTKRRLSSRRRRGRQRASCRGRAVSTLRRTAAVSWLSAFGIVGFFNPDGSPRASAQPGPVVKQYALPMTSSQAKSSGQSVLRQPKFGASTSGTHAQTEGRSSRICSLQPPVFSVQTQMPA